MYYGQFGGQYVPQELKEKLNAINLEFNRLKKEKEFKVEYLNKIKYKKDDIVVICLSGRGDKDIDNILNYKGANL